jgi:gliding motility-associated-like protein
MEMYYDYLGSNNYKITLKVYRDCSPANTNNTQFDNPAPIAIYTGGGTLVQVLSVNYQSVVNVPIVINDPCLQPPANICVEAATYVTTVNLPPSADGYDLVYQRCCRNPTIINIWNPQDMGASIIAHIPASGITNSNSNPRFNQLPPLVICNNSDFQFDHSATDPDGDLLVYEFYTPFHGGDPSFPLPNPPLPPPFTTVQWNPGFGVNNQIQGSPSFTVNSSTGLFSGTPSQLGVHVYGIKVSEYRNGQLLSVSFREFQTTVTNCPSVVVSSIPTQTQLCTGPTYTFGNSSQNSTYYHWDFGVAGTNADTSNLFSPTFTFPDTGTYTITLIANPGFSCADTALQTYTVHDPLDPTFPDPGAQCIDVNSFDFDLSGNFSSDAIINWNFGAAANPGSSTLQDPQNVVYSDSGAFTVSVTVEEYGCIASYSDVLYVAPLPIINFTYPMQAGCAPFLASFSDATYAWGTVAHLWNFGDGSTSPLPNPVHWYPNPGVYDLSLTISVDSVCVKTETITIPDAIVVNPSPVASIVMDPIASDIWDPLFTAYDQSSGGITQTIYFDNGYSATDSSMVTTAFLTSGTHTIYQIVTNEFACTDTAYATVFVEGMTTIFVPNAFTPDGDGLNEYFRPVAYDVSNFEFLIFNRWGEIIFQTNDPNNPGWNGTRKDGKICPIDVYVYQVNYRDWEGMDRLIRGHFTLVR